MSQARLVAAAALGTLLTGCVNMPLSQPNHADHAKITKFEPDPEKGILYVYRDRESHFGLFHMTLQIEGKDDIDTAPASFVRVELEPGTYHLEGNHTDIFGFEEERDITLIGGDVQYIEFKPVARFIVPGSTYLIPVEAEKAKSTILTQQLVPLVIEKR